MQPRCLPSCMAVACLTAPRSDLACAVCACPDKSPPALPAACRPLLHAMFNPGVKGSFGIELDSVKVRKAKTFMRGTLMEMANRGHRPKQQHQDPDLHCCMVEEVSVPPLLARSMHAGSCANHQQPGGISHSFWCLLPAQFASLEPATHAYSFWEGIPLEGRKAFGRLFASTQSLQAIAVVQRAIRGREPAGLMRELGFGPLALVSNFAVSMSGELCACMGALKHLVRFLALCSARRRLPY